MVTTKQHTASALVQAIRGMALSTCNLPASSRFFNKSQYKGFLSKPTNFFAGIARNTEMASISKRIITNRRQRKPSFIVAVVNFPEDYDEVLEQAKDATKAALNDGKKLLEVEFPTAGLESVSGDAEGGIEMTSSMVLIRDFCLNFLASEQYTRTRIFFPDINEVAAAKAGIFEGTFFKLDYLTKPSGLEDIGFTKKVRVVDHLKPTDEMIVVAYPYFNVNEMLAVEELYTKATSESKVPILVFNGELDRIRSGYYPPFFYPKLGALSKSFLPKFETVYYIHNFKGSRGGTLFRAYPGPWQVLRRVSNGLVCVHEQETMPSLKEVALDILMRFLHAQSTEACTYSFCRVSLAGSRDVTQAQTTLLQRESVMPLQWPATKRFLTNRFHL